MARSTVWKYLVDPETQGGHFTIQAPENAKPVLFEKQDGDWFVWLEVAPTRAMQASYDFCVVGTGFDIPPDHTHVQSTRDGAYVWHLYQSNV